MNFSTTIIGSYRFQIIKYIKVCVVPTYYRMCLGSVVYNRRANMLNLDKNEMCLYNMKRLTVLFL